MPYHPQIFSEEVCPSGMCKEKMQWNITKEDICENLEVLRLTQKNLTGPIDLLG